MSPEYREREKLSWSERDKRKDRSPHTRDSREGRDSGPLQDKRALSNYKANLERLFSPSAKQSPQVSEELKALREISDRSEFVEKADAYLANHELPAAWEDLQNFLRHKSSDVLSKTITLMAALVAEQSPTRKGNFEKDLRLIEMTTRDKELRKQVTALLRSMSEPAPSAGT